MEKEFLEFFKDALEIEDREVKMNDEFREFEEWSSLGQLSLIAMLDDEYDIVIETDEFEQLLTVGDVLKVIQKQATN
ncbi:MAG: acyl carrier protein [Carboxylicivirga sp.]|jgi:acyl carrier protein|nr:acyl carrier protein [Carboxylicivirga sp.]MCT4643581.1 acyl carrier protein [Carboxylicivirga sp.]